MEYTIKLKFSDVQNFVNFCISYSKKDVDIDIIQGKYIVNGKSILGILSLDLSKPMTFYCKEKNEILKEKISSYITDNFFDF